MKFVFLLLLFTTTHIRVIPTESANRFHLNTRLKVACTFQEVLDPLLSWTEAAESSSQ